MDIRRFHSCPIPSLSHSIRHFTMEIWFDPSLYLDRQIRKAAAQGDLLDESFDPQLRSSDPRHGDFQANGVLPASRKSGQNPREIALRLTETLEKSEGIDGNLVECAVAGPGFINFRLKAPYLMGWLTAHKTREQLHNAASGLFTGRSFIVDYSSPNTAKQMHVGHIRSTVIGEALCRLVEFCGAAVQRDNHIGDWGTQFGILLWIIKKHGYDPMLPTSDPLAKLEVLYKEGVALTKEDPAALDEARQELVDLQNGNAENLAIWKNINAVSYGAFEKIYEQLGIRFDTVLGESFYRDDVERIYRELIDSEVAKESRGALVVFHPEHPRFCKQPFIIRKTDGASNYGTTDLATILHRVEHYKASDILYVVDSRQSDHFAQLFLTVQKWFQKKPLPIPQLEHISFGTILGNDGKAIRTRDGEPVKLKDLLDEAIDRAYAIVSEKNPELGEDERRKVAKVVGLGAVKYADLMQNRTSDYLFSWAKMLSFEGNTAPYLLYAVARIHSIFRRAGLQPGEGEENASDFDTEPEMALARKLVEFSSALNQTLSDWRPHFLCGYLFELAGVFSTFYNADKVIVDDPQVRARRFILCARTLLILETGLHLLGLETLERM